MVCHLSEDVEPPSGLGERLQEDPASNQYFVGVVVRVWPTDEPTWRAVNVGALGEPPPVIEYESVSKNCLYTVLDAGEQVSEEQVVTVQVVDGTPELLNRYLLLAPSAGTVKVRLHDGIAESETCTPLDVTEVGETLQPETVIVVEAAESPVEIVIG